MAKARKQGSAGRTAGIVIAFILVFAILAGVLTYVLGGFNGLIYDRYTLDTSTAALADGAEAKKDEDLTYIGLGTGTATYTVNATADAQAELTLRLGAAEADKQLSDLVTVTVNSVGYTIGNAVVKGDKNGAFREVTAGQISVNEGKNVIRIGGKAAGVKLEWIRLQVPRGVKITTLESGPEADAGGGMVTTPGQDEDETGVSLVTRKIARENFAEYGIAPTALSAQVITATVSNGDSQTDESYQDGTWSWDWTTDNAEKSITDYVTFSPEGRTLTVSCTQAFSVQITVKYTSALNSAKVGVVHLDYAKTLNGFKVKILGMETTSGLSGTNMIEGPADYLINESGANADEEWTKPMFELTYLYGEGSLENPVTEITFSVTANSSSTDVRAYNAEAQRTGKETPQLKMTKVQLPAKEATNLNGFYSAMTGAAESDLHKLGIYRCFSLASSASTRGGGEMFQLTISATCQYRSGSSKPTSIIRFAFHCPAPNITDVQMSGDIVFFG